MPSKCGSQTKSMGITQELVRNGESVSHSRLTESESAFSRDFLGDSDAHLSWDMPYVLPGSRCQ